MREHHLPIQRPCCMVRLSRTAYYHYPVPPARRDAAVIASVAGRAPGSSPTTQRYMHVSPAAIEEAIRLLESPGGLPVVETLWSFVASSKSSLSPMDM